MNPLQDNSGNPPTPPSEEDPPLLSINPIGINVDTHGVMRIYQAEPAPSYFVLALIDEHGDRVLDPQKAVRVVFLSDGQPYFVSLEGCIVEPNIDLSTNTIH